MRDCKQVKCGFHKSQGNIGCPTCEFCGTEPHLINEQCDKCWNCENDDCIIRGAQSKGVEQEQKKVVEVRNG